MVWTSFIFGSVTCYPIHVLLVVQLRLYIIIVFLSRILNQCPAITLAILDASLANEGVRRICDPWLVGLIRIQLRASWSKPRSFLV
ncbi:hypothetical protein B0H17DRAFT_220985 [Mycena rosella]|uniref:Uncharacterized protein n=1 Tax=Mycena rosella TaxID=1033263 RepID=A0AAD7CX33_MYCRO|nr:hypothetical protein B0H17DRAFT_220985 [Mycena rosella]